MTTKKRTGAILVAGLLLATPFGPAVAQSSASFALAEAVINAGGNPLDGTRPTSASFRISLDSIGDPAARRMLSSASYRAEGGFVARYLPADEVQGVRFVNQSTVVWNHEPSVGTYNLYRNTLASLPGNLGICLQSALAQPTFTDAATPAAGAGWYYLVTAENRLRQEGTKGHGSDGAERPNAAPCP
jgi:hypothetical protein